MASTDKRKRPVEETSTGSITKKSKGSNKRDESTSSVSNGIEDFMKSIDHDREDNRLFSIWFSSTSEFKLWINNLGNTLEDCTLSVKCDCLLVETADKSKTPFIHAKLDCLIQDADFDARKEEEDDDITFRVDLKNMGLFLNNQVEQKHFLFIKCVGDRLIFTAFDPVVPNEQIIWSMPLQNNDDYKKIGFAPISYDFTVNLKLDIFKGIIKMCKQIKQDTIRFTIAESEEQCNINGSNAKISFFQIKYENIYASFEKIFKCIKVLSLASSDSTSDSDSSTSSNSTKKCDIKLCDEYQNNKPFSANSILAQKTIYNNSYSVAYLDNFTKYMDTLELKMEFSSSNGLMLLEHEINDIGYIRYVIAPKVEEEEE